MDSSELDYELFGRRKLKKGIVNTLTFGYKDNTYDIINDLLDNNNNNNNNNNTIVKKFTEDIDTLVSLALEDDSELVGIDYYIKSRSSLKKKAEEEVFEYHDLD